MAITTFFELKEAIGNWMNKRSALADRIPEFIALAEARFRRRIEDADQEASATITLTNGAGPLPANFGRLISVNDSTIGRVEYVSESQFADYDATVTASSPVIFTISEGQVKALPAGNGSLSIIYKLGLPALSDANTTNWLLTRAPDIYLFGSLVQAEFYGWNDERLPMIKSALDEAMEELAVDSERRRLGSAPLAPRPARP